MRYITLIVFVCLVNISFIFAQDTVNLTIAAKVENEIILSSEVDDLPPFISKTPCEYLEWLIQQKLLFIGAKENNFTPTDQELELYLDKLNFPKGRDREFYKNEVQNEIMIDMMNAHILKKTSISPKEVREFADSTTLQMIPKSVKIIEFTSANKDTLESLQQKLQSIKELKTIASRGNYIVDDYTKGSIVPVENLSAHLFFFVDSSKSGDYSRIIRKQSAYAFFYLEKKIPAHKPTFDTDYEYIASIALKLKQRRILNRWFDLPKNQSYITIAKKYKNCNF